MSAEDQPTQPISHDPADAATSDAARNEPMEDTMTTPITSGAAATTPGAPGTTTAPEAAPHASRRPVRVGTIVWGLVLAAIGVGILAFALGVVFDVQLASIAVITAAGVLLLVGSVATSRRHRS